MVHTFIRSTILAALAILPTAGFATAQGIFIGPPPSVVSPQPLTGKRGRVAREMVAFGYGDVDVSILSDRTVALLDNVIHGGGSHSLRAGRIGSVLSRGGILQRALESVSGRY